MLSRRRILSALMLVPLIFAAVPALALEHRPFTEQAFAAAQAANKSIIVEVQAPWCPICAKQKVIVGELEKKPEFKDLVFLTVDFDSQKDVLKKFRVTRQSTYISFTGKDEMQRSTGVTDRMSLEALLQTAL
jgi:thioredoxin 1